MMREAHVIFFFSSLTQDKKTFENFSGISFFLENFKTLNRKEGGEQPLVFFFGLVLFQICPKREAKEIFERKISRITRYIIHTHFALV